MKPFGKLFIRVAVSLSMVLFVLAIAVPSGTDAAASVFQSDDFNRCGYNTALWTFENPANLPAATVTGAYQATSDGTLSLTIPAGKEITFSSTNLLAPRLMQKATDGDFELEVKFSSPLGQVPVGTWNMQGILIKDTTSVPGKTRWLRFDFDSNNSTLNYFIGYIDENSVLHTIFGPGTGVGPLNSTPLYLRVKYVQSTDTWSVGYKVGTGTFAYKKTFLESAPLTDLPNGFSFVVSGLGVFNGSTAKGTATPPGYVSKIDYVRNVADTTFVDDNINLNVQQVGSGTINRTCSGTTVTLTAQPAGGWTFKDWTGDLTSANPTLNVPMTKSYNLTATFTSGPPIDYTDFLYLPYIRK